jgi:hypothetical protein
MRQAGAPRAPWANYVLRRNEIKPDIQLVPGHGIEARGQRLAARDLSAARQAAVSVLLRPVF